MTVSSTAKVHRQTGGMRVVAVLQSEENIWSPAYGLKGKIDLTVLAELHGHGQGGGQGGGGTQLVLPFELKTGRAFALVHHCRSTAVPLPLHCLSTPAPLPLHRRSTSGTSFHAAPLLVHPSMPLHCWYIIPCRSTPAPLPLHCRSADL